uniref:Uncharacterized protein n=1 Tax=Arundo donax TaxID=35708 RepID=A0A0A9HUD1_ARUDO
MAVVSSAVSLRWLDLSTSTRALITGRTTDGVASSLLNGTLLRMSQTNLFGTSSWRTTRTSL